MRQLYRDGKIGWSFEVFPPKAESALEPLYNIVADLNKYDPIFFSITYGAGGSTQGMSLEIAKQIIARFGSVVTSHFTCVGSTVEQIRDWLQQASKTGVKNIMALRGDPPKGQAEFQATQGGFRYASELIQFIRKEFPQLGIGVAGYPETHQEAISPTLDLENLKRKVDNGGDVIYTQLFYDNDDFFRYRDTVKKLGITNPVIPGLLPVLSLQQVQRITTLCKSRIPDVLLNKLQQASGSAEAQVDVGVEHCSEQLEELLKEGVPGVHFYVLNRSDTIRRIMSNIGL